MDQEVNLDLALNYWDQGTEFIRNQIQLIFDWYRQIFGFSDTFFEIFSPIVLWSALFGTLGGLFFLLDHFRWPTFLYRYKTKHSDISTPEIISICKTILFQHLLIHPPVMVVFYYLGNLRGMDRTPRIPPLSTIFAHVLVCSVVVEVTFYYLHRMMHIPVMYRKFHKVHHQYQAVQALVATYCHPVEHVFVNLLSTLLGPLLLGSHLSVILIWVILVVIHVMLDHSGFHFPYSVSPHYHDYHHARFNENYSRHNILDNLHGTNVTYWNTIYAKRHRTLRTLTPITVLIPDSQQ